MQNKEKLIREKEYHDEVFANPSLRESALKYYEVCTSFMHYRQALLPSARGKRVLEYGCGPGSLAFDLARQGAQVTGIDLSEVAISQACRRADAEGLTGIDFRVMNAEELEFSEESFDVVCGSAILHHLDLEKAYAALARTLRPDGKAVFIEPLGHNPLINLYMRLTPSMRTEDEHPLLSKDVVLARQYFGCVDVRFFTLQTLLAVPFRRTSLFGPIRRSLEALDSALFWMVPPTGWLAWQASLALSCPRK